MWGYQVHCKLQLEVTADYISPALSLLLVDCVVCVQGTVRSAAGGGCAAHREADQLRPGDPAQHHARHQHQVTRLNVCKMGP